PGTTRDNARNRGFDTRGARREGPGVAGRDTPRHIEPLSAPRHDPLPATSRDVQAFITASGHTHMECNLCGCSSFYGKATTREIICRQCHSFPRTRLLAMFLEREPMDSSTRVLHLAPEEGLYNRLKTRISPGNYHVRDFNPGRYKFCPDI